MSPVREPLVDRWGRTEQNRIKDLYRLLYHRWHRVEWQGVENLPRRGAALLVANHAGMLPIDGAMITIGVQEEIGRSVYSLAHHGFWRFPFTGPLLSAFGAVVAHPDNAHRLLTEEKSLVLVLPEGAKGPTKPASERYQLARFGRGGFVETAMRAGAPIVPIALMGTEDTTPTLTTFRALGNDVPLSLNALLFGPLLGSVLQFPAKIRGRVLPPIHYDDPTDLEHYPRSVLMDRAEAIREQIQQAIREMLVERKSIWEG